MKWLDYIDEKGDLIGKSVDEFGSPQYILDEDTLVKKLGEVRRTFLEHYKKTRFFYPYKTNSVKKILELIHRHGFGSEVSSLIEMEISKSLGVNASIFNSPGKTDDEIEYAIKNRTVIVIDSEAEIGKVKKAYEKTTIKPRIALRLRPKRPMDRLWSRFGIPVSDLKRVSLVLNEMDMPVEGLHFHVGSGMKNATCHVSAIKEIGRELRDRDARECIDLSFVDIGGGLSPGGYHKKDLIDLGCQFTRKYTRPNLSLRRNYFFGGGVNLPAFAESIEQALRESITPYVGDVELWVEPGRLITAECMHLVTRTLSVRKGSAVVDAGINALPNSKYEAYPTVNISKPSSNLTKFTVYGPLCMSDDRLSEGIFGEEPKIDDLICFMNVGAYNIALSTQFIKPLTRVVSISGGQIKQIRREENAKDRIKRELI